MSRRSCLGFSLPLLWLAACAPEELPPSAPPPPPAPPPVAAPAPSPTAPPVASGPTVLTEAQRDRDAALAPLATAVVDAYPNWNGFFSSLVATFSPDGKRFVFGSTRDGLPEIYVGEVGQPSAAARALTSGPERAIWAEFTPDGKQVLFLRDQQGDESHAIWRVNVDGTGLANLTPGRKLQRGEPIVPARRPRTMFYDARDQSALGVEIVSQSLDGGEPKVLYRDPGLGGLSDVTPDGARAAIGHVVAKNDEVLSELDVATGKAHRLYPAEGAHVGLHGAAYSADGKRIFVSTDEGKEASVLLCLDAATGKVLARRDGDPPTAAMSLAVSPSGQTLAVGVDLGHHGEVRLLDARTLRPLRPVKVPLGDVRLGRFSPDGRSLSLLVSLPDRPADVFAADVATGEVRPLRSDARPGLEGLPAISASIEDVKAFDGLTIPVNRYLPRLEPWRRAPTIAIFHGGPATSYAVRWNAYARFFVARGYAVVEPNVRGSSGFGRAYERADDREKRADWLKDLESVNAWLKAQPWCDPERVVVWGQSYGGYTTLMALTRQPTLWRAGVDLYGPADLKAFLRTTDPTIRSFFVTEFGDLDRDGALLDEFSPMRDKDRIVRPLFVYAGANDPRVPLSESDTIVRALRERSVPVEYMVAAREGHTVDRRETKIELLTRTARFLEDALR